uniref:HAD-IIA family hydrolase n=1 Tax=Mesocestoides corti TaxID=53468 RepID=A0A5K3FLV3_MESCO
MLRINKTFLFDADGTVWDAGGLIKGAAELLRYLKQSGRRVFLVTNNSTKSVEKYLEKCQKLGLSMSPSEIVCSANIAANFLSSKGIKGPLYVIGESGIAEELNKVGIEHFGIGVENTTCNEFNATHLRENVPGILVGFDRYFNYVKLMKAASYLSRGCQFFITNEDALLPSADFALPGTGAIAAAVRKTSTTEPTVFGKPSKAVWNFIKEKYGGDEKTTIIIGDRLDTDIQMGKVSGLHTACVMSGVTSESLLAEVRSDPAKEELLGPELVFPSVLEIYQQLIEEDKMPAEQ